MFDLSWTEILVIGAAALIFIRPKELPSALRTAGRFVSKARSMAREFQNNVEEMVRESELDELRKQVNSAASGDFARDIEKQIDPKGEITSAFAPPELPSLESPPPTSASPGTTSSPGAEGPAPAPAPAPTSSPVPPAETAPPPTPRPPT